MFFVFSRVFTLLDLSILVPLLQLPFEVRGSQDGVHWPKALRFLTLLSLRGIQPDGVCMNSLIAACEKGCRWQQATILGTETTFLHPLLDSIAFGALISSSRGEPWRRSLDWLTQMFTVTMPTLICYNACIDACEKGGQWQFALILLDGMVSFKKRPDEVTLTSLISACPEQSGHWKEAFCILDLMRWNRVTPNVRSYSAAIAALHHEGTWRCAAELWCDMTRHDLHPNEVSGNAMLGVERRRWFRAASLLAATMCTGVRMNLVGVNSCLTGEAGCWPVSLQMIRTLQTTAIRGSVDTFSAAITMYEKSILWEDALQVCVQTLNVGLEPDLICFNALTSAFAQGACWTLATSILREIRSRSVVTDFITRNAVLTSCGGIHLWQIALGLLDRSQHHEVPDMEAQSASVASCAKSFQWALGLCLLQDLLGGRVAFGAAPAVGITNSLNSCLGSWCLDSPDFDSSGSQPAQPVQLRVPWLLCHLDSSAVQACSALLDSNEKG